MKRLVYSALWMTTFLGAVAATSAGERALTGEEIRQTLTGNSIISPDFGCVHFAREGVANLFTYGQVSEASWRIDGNLYFSSGQCGEIGCQFFGDYPSFVFRRVDGSYEQPVLLIIGNHCERDGIFS